MSEIKLTTPEGFFEKSFERTLAETGRIRHRRRVVLGCFLAAVLVTGAYLSFRTAHSLQEQKNYLALQEEMAKLDIFLEVNCF